MAQKNHSFSKYQGCAEAARLCTVCGATQELAGFIPCVPRPAEQIKQANYKLDELEEAMKRIAWRTP